MQEQNLKEIVNELLDMGYSQSDLASEVEVSQMAVSLWSRGKSEYTNYKRHMILLKLLEEGRINGKKSQKGRSRSDSNMGCEAVFTPTP